MAHFDRKEEQKACEAYNAADFVNSFLINNIRDKVGKEKARYVENEQSLEEVMGSNELEIYDLLSCFKFVEFTITVFVNHHLCNLKVIQLVFEICKLTHANFDLIQLVIIVELIIYKICQLSYFLPELDVLEIYELMLDFDYLTISYLVVFYID